MNEPDNRVEIELDLDDELLFTLMKKAHEHDITFNQYIEYLLKEYAEFTPIEKEKS